MSSPLSSTAWPSGPARRVAIVAAQWHADIVSHAVESCVRGLDGFDVDVFDVPGAFEIPLHVQRLAGGGVYDAVAACAFVVDGGIYRHEFVASAVVDGLMRVQLTSDVPVFSGVLTPHQFHEHSDHRAFFADHFVVKGEQLARAIKETLTSLEALRG